MIAVEEKSTANEMDCESVSKSTAADDQDSAWATVCAAFFFKDEARFVQHAPKDVDGTAGEAVVLAVEQLREGNEIDFGSLGNKVVEWLDRVGCKTSTRDEDHLARLWKLKDDHRRAFHVQIAQLRYTAYLDEMIHLLESRKAQLQASDGDKGSTDVESGVFHETEAMAECLRQALTNILNDFGNNMSFAPVLSGLHAALRNQLGNAEVTGWRLDDAALVERGHAFASAVLQVLLSHLRCNILGGVPSSSADQAAGREAHTYVFPEHLSDRRIQKILYLFPDALRTGPDRPRVAQAGQPCNLDDTQNIMRTNQDGQHDAPFDVSLWSAIISRCDIL